MPALRSIIAFRFAADGAPVLSSLPKGASRWSLPVSLALHAAIAVLVASLHTPPPPPPGMVVSVELSFLDDVAEPPSASETAVEMGGAAQPEPLPDETVEQTVEPAPQPAVESPDPIAAAPVEAPTPKVTGPVPRPSPKPVRPRSPPVASPRPSTPDPAADRIAQAAPAQPVQMAPPPSNPSPGSDREAADYFTVIQARLARHKIYPRPARLTRQEGIVLVRFTVASDGTVTGWSIVQGSGHEILDQAAVDLIRRASPLPPIPAGMGRTHIDITLPVQYSLQ